MTEQTVTDGSGSPVFLGRRDELAALRSDIQRAGLDTLAGRPADRGRVLLIAGRPGTGRTALAEEFAAELLAGGDYPDGLLRARLTDPGGEPVPVGRAARALLGELGAAAPPGAGDDELSDTLREALCDRRAVLLLDDVATADQLAELIPDGRHCLVLAIARGPLTKVPDVRPCTLGALDRVAAIRLLERGAGDVRITVDPGAGESLAESCGHLPAALLLASGWLAAHPEATVADAVRRMRTPPDDDEPGDKDAPGDAPHPGQDPPPDAADEPLRRAFRLAHSTLPAPVARMLRLLVLAPSGIVDAHAAAALAGCPMPAARARLAGLAEAGMLRPVPGRVAPGGPQYLVPGCLEPLLLALLRRHERPAEALLARARILERTVRLLRACQAVTEPHGSPARQWLAGLPGSLRFDSRPAAAGWLASREQSLMAAARVAVADGQLDTLARRLVAALSRALIAHRGADAAAPELYRLHELVLGVAERRGLARERAAALLNLGDLDARAGRLNAALERYREALETARREGDQADPLAVGRTLESIAGTYGELGDWQRAADWYGRAVALALSRGDLAAQARLHGRVGAALACTAQWGEALRAWRAAAATHRRVGDGRAHARAVAEIARVQEYAGRAEDSLRTGEEALRLAERTGDRRLQAALRLRLADCADRLGRGTAAAAHRAAAEHLLAHARPASPESSVTPEGNINETQPEPRQSD
ncbi:tetratricopeptide repeat protein [Streptomyces litchfieldiae]|uniref:Tetratricopeptide repeat protein n=1 Tax=Streptomyces litchfieldiae TaxID=3075543 RepID=A0ABU2MVJ5_9ACTN|nr:tetratricopeptide repeat protein [Streptomyces sp. DSM 44938]MDT0345535.1 tetratricopeptide repeat protein [Streptomyces sp. DSM 44938]